VIKGSTPSSDRPRHMVAVTGVVHGPDGRVLLVRGEGSGGSRQEDRWNTAKTSWQR